MPRFLREAGASRIVGPLAFELSTAPPLTTNNHCSKLFSMIPYDKVLLMWLSRSNEITKNKYRKRLKKHSRVTAHVFENTQCLEWTASGNPYGKSNILRHIVYAHRMAFVLARGVVPEGEVMHKCNNPKCINPEHLVEGSHAENMQYMHECGRHEAVRGEANKSAKLTIEQVREARALYRAGTSAGKIARRFGVSQVAAWKMVTNKSWRHVV